MDQENQNSRLSTRVIPEDKTVRAAHTPTPWCVDVEEYDWESDGKVIAGLITIREIERCLHDTDWAESEDWERDLANANLIVNAVNSYDALVEVARMLDMLDWCVGYELGAANQDILDKAQQMARAALALAEKENQ